MVDRGRTDIAIIGMACIFPGAGNLETYWKNIVSGHDAISVVPESRWESIFYDRESTRPDRLYCRRGGFIDDYADFDAVRWGIMPVAARSSEPDQLLALQVAFEALGDAGYEDRDFSRERTGVVLGRGGYLNPGWTRLTQVVRSSQEIVNTLRRLVPEIDDDRIEAIREDYISRAGNIGPDTVIGLVPNLAASRIANRLDLKGASYTVDAACASSLIAVERGCTDLIGGRSDLVLAGGVHINHDPAFWSVFCQLGAMSREETIRPFDRRADGLLVGEGLGVVVLKRRDDAERDGDRIYAVVRGAASSSDGRGSSLMNPKVEGQMLALERAWQMAGLDPTESSSVGLIEAHGTATPNGDEAELETLSRCFGKPADSPSAVVGSVKSMIGHAMPAAGVAGLIKATLAVHHGILPPTLHCEDPTPNLESTRFRPIANSEPWEANGTPRRAGVNAFGFGGINAHVVLEEAGSAGRSSVKRRPQATHQRQPVFLAAAASPGDLAAALESGRPGVEGDCRLAVLDPTPERLEKARTVVARGRRFSGRSGIWFSPKGLIRAGGKVAFLFPGFEPDFEPQTADVESFFERPLSLPDLGEAKQGDLITQGAAVVQVSRLMHEVLGSLGLRADVVAGHSIGEWSAMIAAGALPAAAIDEFITTLEPGMLQVPGVVFAAAGCGRERVETLLGDLDDVVISHDNCPHQTVLCGPEELVDQAVSRLGADGVLAQKLDFRSGFHSPFFERYVDPVRADIESLPVHAPTSELWSATTCSPYPADPGAIRDLFVEHLVKPVRFRELTEKLYADGVRFLVQVGQGSLVGFVDDVLSDRDHVAVAANDARREGMAQLARVVAAAWVEGADVDTERLLAPIGLPGSKARSSLRLELGAPMIDVSESLRLPGGHRAERVSADDADPVLGELAASLEALEQSQLDVVAAWEKRKRTSPDAPRRHVMKRRVSLANCPFLVGHSFFRQPPDWPDDRDRFVTVPATMSIGMMAQAAVELAALRGRSAVAVGLRDVRALRWIEAGDPVDLETEASLEDEDTVSVRIGDFISATVLVADEYPEPPQPDLGPLTAEREPPFDPAEMYAENWTFHGPEYQSVASIESIGDDGFRGQLIALEAEGSLLDAATQLLGVWIGVVSDADRMAFPVGAESIRFFGPHPEVGTRTECLVRILRYGERQVQASFSLVVDGRMWCQVTGWTDQRFFTDDRLWTMIRFPEGNLLAIPVEEIPDCVWLPQGFDGRGIRDLMAWRFLNREERRAYDGMKPRRQIEWLSGRIAAKDAARQWLASNGQPGVFPVEIDIRAAEDGTVTAHCGDGGVLRLSISHKSVAHRGGQAVARVSAETPVGIDLERIEAHDDSFVETAFREQELELLADVSGAERDEWLTRMWTAKEAVAKMQGGTLARDLQNLTVEQIVGDRLRVAGCWVRTLRREEMVVAWTEGAEAG